MEVKIDTINNWITTAYGINNKNGFHDGSYSDNHRLMMIVTEIATIVRSEQYLHLPSMFSSVVGRTSAERDKTWIIDIDTKDEGIRQEARDFLPTIEPNLGLNKIWMEIETLHGVHLISTPFNLQKFKARFPDIDVHKDNPTLLYFKSLC